MRRRKQPLPIVARNVIAIGNPNSSKKKCGPTNLFSRPKDKSKLKMAMPDSQQYPGNLYLWKILSFFDGLKVFNWDDLLLKVFNIFNI